MKEQTRRHRREGKGLEAKKANSKAFIALSLVPLCGGVSNFSPPPLQNVLGRCHFRLSVAHAMGADVTLYV